MKTYALFLFLVSWILGWSFHSVAASAAGWPSPAYLMVDQNGNFYPPGYTAGMTDIARTEAQAAAVAQSTAILGQALEGASNVVNGVVTALTGTFGFCYVTGYTVSFAGAVQVSTNAAAQIALLEMGAAGSTNIAGTAYTGHYVWHAYSEAMNATPTIKYRTNLDATNTWTAAEYQDMTQYQNVTINGVLFETIYRSRVWMPTAYNNAFFQAFCEIFGGGQAGAVFKIVTGFSIGGKVGFTGDLVENGFRKHYEYGTLMTITPEVP